MANKKPSVKTHLKMNNKFKIAYIKFQRIYVTNKIASENGIDIAVN